MGSRALTGRERPSSAGTEAECQAGRLGLRDARTSGGVAVARRETWPTRSSLRAEAGRGMNRFFRTVHVPAVRGSLCGWTTPPMPVAGCPETDWKVIGAVGVGSNAGPHLASGGYTHAHRFRGSKILRTGVKQSASSAQLTSPFVSSEVETQSPILACLDFARHERVWLPNAGSSCPVRSNVFRRRF